VKKAAFQPSFFTSNRKKLATLLPPKTLALFFANDRMPRTGDQHFPFRQNSDLYYMSGILQPDTILAVCPDHPNARYREVLFIQHADAVRETWDGHRLSSKEATAFSGVETVIRMDEFNQVIDDIAYPSNHIYVNAAEDIKRDNELVTYDLRMIGYLKARFPLHQYGRLAPLMASLRFVKHSEEILVIQNACEITGKAFNRVLSTIRPGMYEYEIEAEMTCEFMRNGASGHAFLPIVASAKNACVLHYNMNNRRIQEGELVLLDFGAELSCYCSDCSRTVPVSGKFTPRQRQLYEAVLRVFRKVMHIIRPGFSIVQINMQAGRFWEEEHIRLGLYSMEDVRRQDPDQPLYRRYFMHGATHSLGLDVHDVCDRYRPIEPGAILTCEPGIYIPEEGIGIRLENDMLVTPTDPIDLMKHIPIEPDEIEERIREFAGRKADQ
jgi:Xaa-Pro aminopeptidase